MATEHGRTVFAEVESAVCAAESGVLAGLDGTEQARFRQLLGRLARQARELPAAHAETANDL